MEHDRSFCLPGIALDRSCGETLQRQLYSRIAEAIRTGEIVRGARLPSTRSMANKLGVSRNTVLAAYDALVADELICGERGSGMRVSGGQRRQECKRSVYGAFFAMLAIRCEQFRSWIRTVICCT